MNSERCKYSDGCFRPCACKQPFSSSIIHPLPCYARAEAQPVEPEQMMICPERDCVMRNGCRHNGAHTLFANCRTTRDHDGDCPACVPAPVEQPAPEPPAPVDLDAVIKRNKCRASSLSSHKTINRLCAEIERLRERLDRDEIEPRLEMAEGWVTRLNRQLGIVAEERNDALQAATIMERQRDALLSQGDETKEQIEELERAAIAREDTLRVVERQRDGMRQACDKRNRELRAARNGANGLKTERDAMRDELRGIANVVGPEVWRTLGDSVVIDAVRALVAERDKLRQRLEMYRTVIEATG